MGRSSLYFLGYLWAVSGLLAFWFFPGTSDASGQNGCNITTFRGNAERNFYGCGYIPSRFRVRWKVKTASLVDPRLKGGDGKPLVWKGTGWTGQAAVVGHRVWFGSVGGVLYSLDRKTGKILWTFSTGGGAIKSSVTYWKGRLYFGSRSDRVYCLDARTGRLLWSYHSPGKDVDSTPIVVGNTLYWGGEDGYLYAADPLSGKIRWRFKTEGSIESSPAVVGGKVFINSFDGHLYALDARTGRFLWRFGVGRGFDIRESFSPLDSSLAPYRLDFFRALLYQTTPHIDDTDTTPTYYRGVLYFGSENGYLYAVDASSGVELWKRATDGGIWSTPAVGDGAVFVGSNDRYFYAFSARTGRLLWRTKVRDGVWGSPIYLKGRVLFGDWSGYIYVLRAKDGKILFKYQTGDYVISTPSAVGGEIYLGSRDGYFYRFDPVSPRRGRRSRRGRGKLGGRSGFRRNVGDRGRAQASGGGKVGSPVLLAAAVGDRCGVEEFGSGSTGKGDKPEERGLFGKARRLISEALSGGAAWKKAYLARLFGIFPSPLGERALKALFRSKCSNLRYYSVLSMGSYRRERLNFWLMALKDREERVRRVSCVSLELFRRRGGKYSEDLVKALGKVAGNSDLSVAVACSRALALSNAGGGKGETSLRTLFFSSGSSKGKERFIFKEEFRTGRSKRWVLRGLEFLAERGFLPARRLLIGRWFGCRGRGTWCAVFGDWQGWVKRAALDMDWRFLSSERLLRFVRRGLYRRDGNLRLIAARRFLALSREKEEVCRQVVRLMRRERYSPILRLYYRFWRRRCVGLSPRAGGRRGGEGPMPAADKVGDKRESKGRNRSGVRDRRVGLKRRSSQVARRFRRRKGVEPSKRVRRLILKIPYCSDVWPVFLGGETSELSPSKLELFLMKVWENSGSFCLRELLLSLPKSRLKGLSLKFWVKLLKSGDFSLSSIGAAAIFHLRNF